MKNVVPQQQYALLTTPSEQAIMRDETPGFRLLVGSAYILTLNPIPCTIPSALIVGRGWAHTVPAVGVYAPGDLEWFLRLLRGGAL